MIDIKGNFRKYIFKSEQGYVVGLFKIKESSDGKRKNETITFTGYFTDLNENDLYIFHGDFINHEKYGEQFQTVAYEIVLPSEKDKIVDFLSSPLFKGIGKKKAQTIVDYLQEDALNKIIEDKDSLLVVPGITEKQRDLIYETLYKYQASYQTILYLTKLGFSMKDAMAIYYQYKSETEKIIEYNPYLLAEEIKDITFTKIDRLRSNLHIKDDDLNRIKAAILYVMNGLCNSSGNTYLLKEEILTYLNRVLFFYDEELFLKALDQLLEEEKIKQEEDKYFISKMYDDEEFIARRLFKLNNLTVKNINITDNDIEELENFFAITFNKEQQEAIKTSMQNNFLIITGGPGTGKTTIIKAICNLYQKKLGIASYNLKSHLALLAPTGRASKRIAEQTNLLASTIHRFLKWNKEDDSFQVNEEYPSSVDLVIIDEASMIDTFVFASLLKGLKPTAKIIMIGDYHQLASVGPGQILKDLIEINLFKVIKLEKLYRQKEHSAIAVLAHDIVHNQADFSNFNTCEDLLFIEANHSDLKEKLKDYILEYKDLDYHKFQVLAPMYKGENGIDALNNFIEKLVNPSKILKREIVHDNVSYKENDKVLQLVNNLDNNVFNGDIGLIKSINYNSKEIIVDFDGNEVKMTKASLSNIKLGYCISIHKAQGSEFDILVLPVLSEYNSMLYKKIIYTAVTRAKKKLIIIGEYQAFSKAINYDRENNRKTYLKNFLYECMKNS